MAGFLLDTSIIIDFLNGRRGREHLLRSLLDQGHSLGCCAINVAEVYAGMRPKEKTATEFFLRSLVYHDITWDVARRAGRLRQEYGARGVTLSISDVTIAAVAIANHLTLITGNQKHFPMPQVRLYREG